MGDQSRAAERSEIHTVGGLATKGSETPARSRIREAVESRGYRLVDLDWTPPYMGGEMEGWCGGWYGHVDRDFLLNTSPGNDFMGLNLDETLACIDYFIKPPEPCECPERSCPLFPSKGDPQTTVHDPSCRWHIKYQLRWWRVEGSA